MGGHWVQRILGGVADGLELSKRPLCELKNCTGASLRSALFLACINWITQVKSEWDFCRTVHWDIERTTAVPSVMQQHKMIFFFFIDPVSSGNLLVPGDYVDFFHICWPNVTEYTQTHLLGDHLQMQGDCIGHLVGANLSPHNHDPTQTDYRRSQADWRRFATNWHQIYKCRLQIISNFWTHSIQTDSRFIKSLSLW